MGRRSRARYRRIRGHAGGDPRTCGRHSQAGGFKRQQRLFCGSQCDSVDVGGIRGKAGRMRRQGRYVLKAAVSYELRATSKQKRKPHSGERGFFVGRFSWDRLCADPTQSHRARLDGAPTSRVGHPPHPPIYLLRTDPTLSTKGFMILIRSGGGGYGIFWPSSFASLASRVSKNIFFAASTMVTADPLAFNSAKTFAEIEKLPITMAFGPGAKTLTMVPTAVPILAGGGQRGWRPVGRGRGRPRYTIARATQSAALHK